MHENNLRDDDLSNQLLPIFLLKRLSQTRCGDGLEMPCPMDRATMQSRIADCLLWPKFNEHQLHLLLSWTMPVNLLDLKLLWACRQIWARGWTKMMHTAQEDSTIFSSMQFITQAKAKYRFFQEGYNAWGISLSPRKYTEWQAFNRISENKAKIWSQTVLKAKKSSVLCSAECSGCFSTCRLSFDLGQWCKLWIYAFCFQTRK